MVRWHFLKEDGNQYWEVRDEHGRNIAAEIPYRDGASLIAAAPELLAATTAAWHLCESLLASPGATPELIEGVRNACAAAKAKAKGL